MSRNREYHGSTYVKEVTEKKSVCCPNRNAKCQNFRCICRNRKKQEWTIPDMVYIHVIM